MRVAITDLPDAPLCEGGTCRPLLGAEAEGWEASLTSLRPFCQEVIRGPGGPDRYRLAM